MAQLLALYFCWSWEFWGLCHLSPFTKALERSHTQGRQRGQSENQHSTGIQWLRTTMLCFTQSRNKRLWDHHGKRKQRNMIGITWTKIQNTFYFVLFPFLKGKIKRVKMELPYNEATRPIDEQKSQSQEWVTFGVIDQWNPIDCAHPGQTTPLQGREAGRKPSSQLRGWQHLLAAVGGRVGVL